MSEAAVPMQDSINYSLLFEYIYKGDPEAIRVSHELVLLLHVWDDLIDKDREVSAHEINAAFVAALCGIGGSPLWDEHAAHLMSVYYLKWIGANAIEEAPATIEEKATAYVSRAAVFDLFLYFVYKLHGLQWAEEVSELVLRSNGEDFSAYCQEFEFWR